LGERWAQLVGRNALLETWTSEGMSLDRKKNRGSTRGEARLKKRGSGEKKEVLSGIRMHRN